MCWSEIIFNFILLAPSTMNFKESKYKKLNVNKIFVFQGCKVFLIFINITLRSMRRYPKKHIKNNLHKENYWHGKSCLLPASEIKSKIFKQLHTPFVIFFHSNKYINKSTGVEVQLGNLINNNKTKLFILYNRKWLLLRKEKNKLKISFCLPEAHYNVEG